MKNLKYIIIIIFICTAFYSCDDNGAAPPEENNVLFSKDSIVSYGGNSFEVFICGVNFIELNFSLHTNVEIPEPESSRVHAEIFVMIERPFSESFHENIYGSRCNGTFSYTIPLTGNKVNEMYGSVVADTTNGHQYTLKMFNISVIKR